MADPVLWPAPFELNRLEHGPVSQRIVADAPTRERIARALGLNRLDRLEAELELSPWLDGARLRGRWRADVEQTCGVTLEPLQSNLEGEFELKALPEGSPNAPKETDEAVLDLEAEDPPDLIKDRRLDLGGLVIEQVSLQIDPFPRKPGAVFLAPETEAPVSPFAVLRGLKAPPR